MLGYCQAHKSPLKIGFTRYILAIILWMGLSLNLAWAQGRQDDQAIVNMPKQFASSEIANKNTTEININVGKTLPDQSAAPRNQSSPIKTINTTLIAKIDSSIIVKLDGETLDNTHVHRSDNGALYVDAIPIFQSLNNDVKFDEGLNALIVRRSQDGVKMELFTETGIVKQNGRALGRLRHFGEVKKDRFLLTANAIAVLSGAAGQFNISENIFDFKLDPRLKVATGFELYVNDIPLGTLNPTPRSVGPVLLLPLLPIAEALGHNVQIIEQGRIITIRRAQDSAEFTMNLDTGLISLRDKPIGLSKDVTYIDPINLLLPISAIETLTGTHISAQGGSNRIDITLDERLAGAIKPVQSVDEAARATPFTPESVNFTLGPDSLNIIEFNAHGGSFNGQLRYETQDLVSRPAELEPSWLSVNFTHINGVRGSIGDYAADFRELDGVGLRRIRGLALQKNIKTGRLSAVIGAPESGIRQISRDQNRSSFDGLAAGIRYADHRGWEAGISARQDGLSKDKMAVLDVISGRLGRGKDKRLQWGSDVSLGVFNGPARQSSVDLRLGGNIRYEATKTISTDIDVQYDGAEFLRSRLEREALDAQILIENTPEAVIEDRRFIPDNREQGLDQLAVGINSRFTPVKDLSILHNPALSVRANYVKSGTLKTSLAASDLASLGISAATNIGQTGLSLSADASYFKLDFANPNIEKDRGRQFNVQAFKQLSDYTLRAQYRNDKSRSQAQQQALSITASRRSFNVALPKDAKLSVTPSVSALWNGTRISSRGSLFVNVNSGRIFGRQNLVDASFGVFQSASGFNIDQTDRFLTVSVARQLKLGNNLALGLAYRNNLSGNQRLGLQLSGNYEFNEKRRYRETQKGRGVVKGRAFLDKNRDSIKQDDEPAMPRVLIKVKGQNLALRTDNAGYFTIQNIKEGIYELQIDARTLPLGFDLADNVSNKVTIKAGYITDIPMPIVQRGQIRGITYVDDNDNGQYDKGEPRIEGAKLKLSSIAPQSDSESNPDNDNNNNISPTSDEKNNVKPPIISVDKQSYSTSFGQYAFDDLAAGQYKIEVIADKGLDITGGEKAIIDITQSDNLLGRHNIRVYKKVKAKTAKPIITVQNHNLDRTSINP